MLFLSKNISMKKYTYLLLLLIFPFIQNAQTTKIDWGPTYKEKTPEGKNLYSKKMLGFAGDHYYLHASTRKNQHLFQFNSKNELVKSVSADFKYDDEKIRISSLINGAGGDFLISTRYSKKTMYVYSNQLNNDGSISPDVKPLFTYPYLRDKSMKDKQKSDKNDDVKGIWTSSDSTKILFAYVESSWEFNKKKGDEVYHMALFDGNMNLIWNKKSTFPSYTDGKIKVKNFKVADDGKIYALGLVDADEKRKFKYPQRDIALFTVTEDGIDLMEKFKKKDKYLGGGYLHLHDDGTLYFMGTYINKSNKKSFWDGLFIAQYDKDGDQMYFKTHKWKEGIVEKLEKRRDLVFNNAFINYENKSITLAIEEQFLKGNKDKGYMYVSNDIILPSFTFDGELNWMTCVEKDFESDADHCVSFQFGHKDDDIYLIFNDKKNRKERKALNAPVSPLLIYYFTDITKINKDGEIALRETIFNSKELKFYFHVYHSDFVKNGEVLIAGQGIKPLKPNYQFGTIMLD